MTRPWRIGEVRTFAWHPLGQVLPEGATIAENPRRPAHHNRYSVLIEIAPGSPAEVSP